MESLFTIPNRAGYSDYALFYALAFILGSLLVFYEGYRRKWPLIPWLVVINSCAVCAIIGSKLVVIPFNEFTSVLYSGPFPYTSQKSYLGGVLGGIIGIWLARRYLGFRYSVLDTFAFVLPVALATGRIGCLLGGCCFGIPTDLPWGIAYANGSALHRIHLDMELISPGAMTSLPVHPTQIYEIIFCLTLIGFLWKIRKLWKAPGNLFYFSIIMYGSFRFFEEFVRHNRTTIWGLKYNQWALILAVSIMIIFVIIKERKWRRQPQIVELPRTFFYKNLIYIAGILLFLYICRNWFTPIERIVLEIITLSVAAGAGFHLIQTFAGIRPRLILTGIVIASPFLSSMRFQNQTLPDTSKTSFNTVSFGGMSGKYEESCGPTHTYNVGGFGFSRTHGYGKFNRNTIGLRGYIGTDENGGTQTVLGINPYLQLDSRWAGLGLGLHAGNLILDGEPIENNRYTQLSLRLGPYDQFFIEGKLADHSPGSLPAPVIKLGLGFGLPNEGSLRFGFSDAGFYLNPYIPTQSGLIINPFVAFGDEKTHQFGLTLHYRFNGKMK